MMDLQGIGVLLIGIALLIIAIFTAKILNNIAGILKGVDRTVEQLPEQLDTMFDETGKLLHNSNDTLADVNEKLGTLTPIFHIVGDVGESTRRLSSGLVKVSKVVMEKDAQLDGEKKDKTVGNVYGLSTIAYYLFKKGKQKESKGWKTYA